MSEQLHTIVDEVIDGTHVAKCCRSGRRVKGDSRAEVELYLDDACSADAGHPVEHIFEDA